MLRRVSAPYVYRSTVSNTLNSIQCQCYVNHWWHALLLGHCSCKISGCQHWLILKGGATRVDNSRPVVHAFSGCSCAVCLAIVSRGLWKHEAVIFLPKTWWIMKAISCKWSRKYSPGRKITDSQTRFLWCWWREKYHIYKHTLQKNCASRNEEQMTKCFILWWVVIVR